MPTDFSLDTTWGTNENAAVAIPRKEEQRLMRCGPAEGVSMTCSHGRPNSKFLSANTRASGGSGRPRNRAPAFPSLSLSQPAARADVSILPEPPAKRPFAR